MNESMKLLRADIAADEQVIARLFEALSNVWDRLDASEQTIVAGYYLHNLYMAFEHIFERIAESFENQIADKSQWHAQLLRRMTLDVPDVRPHLIDSETYECLDELRRFRHVFRSAYTINLDKDRLGLVVKRAKRLRELYPAEFSRFQGFLDKVGQE
ncbi:MAG: hypothetical protein HZB20_11785 [Chloroflexi bacterium]|nr:hypothetical protein [Chloroflexota bacterium]